MSSNSHWIKICDRYYTSYEVDKHDWLFETNASTCRCDEHFCPDYASILENPFTKVFFPLILIGAAIAIAATSRWWSLERDICKKENGNAVTEKLGNVEQMTFDRIQLGAPLLPLPDVKNEGHDFAGAKHHGKLKVVQRPEIQERIYYMDYIRILCVGCIVTAHSGGEVYGYRNVIWCQQWCLPYLYTISGMAFMMSKKSLGMYASKLLLFFFVGTAANYAADVVNDRDWQSYDLNDVLNTIFQMGYALVLIVFSFLFAPLRDALRWRDENKNARPSIKVIAWTSIYGCVTMGLVALMTTGRSLDRFVKASPDIVYTGMAAFLHNGPYVLATFFGTAFLCCFSCILGSNQWAVWIILTVIYITRIMIPYNKGGHPVSADLFALGMLVQKMPLQGMATVAYAIREYWAFVIAALLLISTPGVTGRCDVHPHEDLLLRARFYMIECIFMVLLLSGSLNTSDSKKVLPWFSMWSIYAYCFHVCWARIFVHPSHGALFTYAAIPVFYAVDKMLGTPSKQSTRPAKPEQMAASNIVDI